MSNTTTNSSAEPTVHRQREQELISHVEKLLNDERLRVDTTRGRRPVTTLLQSAQRTDNADKLKRDMIDMHLPDRDLQNRMPTGEQLEVILSQRKWLVLKTPVGRIKVICMSPTRALLAGQPAQPLKTSDVQKVLSEVGQGPGGVPTTVVLLSTSGFSLEAHELAERRADRTVIMVEPNNAGGWAVAGPVETKSLVDLFDPEAEEAKRARVREQLESSQLELSGSGLASDKLAGKVQLPLQFVEAELKSYAKAHPGLVAKRLDGRVVLFREGTGPASALAGASGLSGGGESMPLLERMKALFKRPGENEKKIAFLSERRAALGQQRDRAYEEMTGYESQEAGLRNQFKEATGQLTKRRVTTQLLNLQKEVARRQQLIGVLEKQIGIVETHLHTLRLIDQGEGGKLPDADEVAEDAARAEEVLAGLEASAEVAGSVGISASTMSDEEAALYAELEKESGGATSTTDEEPAPPANVAARTADTGTRPPASPASNSEPKRSEPEAG